MNQQLNIDAATPWSLRPGPETTMAQIARACAAFDLMVEYSFNEVRIYQRDLDKLPPTGEALAECMFGPGNKATIIEESYRYPGLTDLEIQGEADDEGLEIPPNREIPAEIVVAIQGEDDIEHARRQVG